MQYFVLTNEPLMDKVLLFQPPFHLLSADIKLLSSAFNCHYCKMNFAI